MIVGTIRLPPEKLPDALPAMARMIVASRAEEGCCHYSYAQDVLRPELVHVKEIWRDEASLAAHFRSAHIAEWRATWPVLEIKDRNLVRYEIGEPQPV